MACGNREAERDGRVQEGEAGSRTRRPGGLTTPSVRHVPGSRIAQAGRVASSPTADGAVLVDMSTGRRTRVDHFGQRVWRALSSQPTLPALVTSLRDDGTSAERLAEDVTRLLARWLTQGMIEWR